MYFEVRNIKRLALQVKKTTTSSRASAAGLHNVILSIYLFKWQVYEITDLLWWFIGQMQKERRNLLLPASENITGNTKQRLKTRGQQERRVEKTAQEWEEILQSFLTRRAPPDAPKIKTCSPRLQSDYPDLSRSLQIAICGNVLKMLVFPVSASTSWRSTFLPPLSLAVWYLTLWNRTSTLSLHIFTLKASKDATLPVALLQETVIPTIPLSNLNETALRKNLKTQIGIYTCLLTVQQLLQVPDWTLTALALY